MKSNLIKNLFRLLFIVPLTMVSFSCEEESIEVNDTSIESQEQESSDDKPVGRVEFKAKEGAT